MKHVIVRATTAWTRAIVTPVRIAALAILYTAIFALPGFSQEPTPTTWELNTFGRYTDFGLATNLQSGVGGGVRLGYFVHPRWELEAGAGFTRVAQIAGARTENVFPVLMDITYNHPVGRSQLLLSGGAVYYRYGSSHAWGTSLGAGARFAFGRSAALRVDGTREYINAGNGVVRHSNWGLRVGLSWILPKRALFGEDIAFRRVDLAIAEPARMPVLRDLDPVAILALDTERARRDSATRQNVSLSERRLPDVRVVDLRKPDPHSSIGATIHFDVGGSMIRSDAVRTLEAKLDLLRSVPALRIRIEGQADVRDSSAYNIALAQQRAAAAKQWLVDRGIAADRIEAVGFGQPWQNRRDEFVIVAGADAGVQGRQ